MPDLQTNSPQQSQQPPLTDPREWLAQHSDSGSGAGAGVGTPDGLTDPRKWLAAHSPSASVSSTSSEDDQPGFLRTVAQDMGIPTSMDELRSTAAVLKPQWKDILIPGGPVVRNYLQSAGSAAREAFNEGKEAGENIAEGGPVGANLGKMGYGFLRGGLKLLSPLGGEAALKAGEAMGPASGPILRSPTNPGGYGLPNFGNAAEAAPHIVAAALQAVAGRAAMRPRKVMPEPVPGAPLTAGEAAGPGLRLQAEQIASGLGNAQRVKANFLESRSAPLENAATATATREIAPTPQPGAPSPVAANDQITTTLKNANESARTAESAAHRAVAQRAVDRGITIDPGPLADTAKQILSLEGPARDLITSSLPSNVLRLLEKASAAEGEDPIARVAREFGWSPDNLSPQQVTEINKDLAAHPPTAAQRIPFDVMKTARTGVGEALEAAQRHYASQGMGGNAVTALSKLYGEMTQAMEGSLAQHPDLLNDWRNANRLTTARNATFVDPRMIRQAILGDEPVKVIDQVLGKGKTAEMKALKTALANDPQATATAQDAIHQWVLERAQRMGPKAAVQLLKDRPQVQDLLGAQRYEALQRDVARSIFDKVTEGAKAPAMGRQDMFDAQHFADSYRKARPALNDLLPHDNIRALDDLERTMRRYAHQTFGSGGGFGKWRIAMAPVMLTYGILLGSPYGMVEGAAALGGPRLYTELAMNPAFARSVSATVRTLATGVPVAGAIRAYQNQSYKFDGKRWVKVDIPQQPDEQRAITGQEISQDGHSDAFPATLLRISGTGR